MKRRNSGFSLTELMVVVAILGVLSGLVIDAGIRDWRREQVNAVVVELAGWLESVRRAALKGSSCQVRLISTNVTLAAGDQMAQGEDVGTADADSEAAASPIPNNCRSSQPFVIPSIGAVQRFQIRATEGNFVFTPAGTLYPAPVAPIVIQVALADGQDPQRCVQLEGLMGVIQVGRVSAGNCVTDN